MLGDLLRLTRAAARMPRTLEAASELPDAVPRVRRELEDRVDLLLAMVERLDVRVADVQAQVRELRATLPEPHEGPLSKVRHALSGEG